MDDAKAKRRASALKAAATRKRNREAAAAQQEAAKKQKQGDDGSADEDSMALVLPTTMTTPSLPQGTVSRRARWGLDNIVEGMNIDRSRKGSALWSQTETFINEAGLRMAKPGTRFRVLAWDVGVANLAHAVVSLVAPAWFTLEQASNCDLRSLGEPNRRADRSVNKMPAGDLCRLVVKHVWSLLEAFKKLAPFDEIIVEQQPARSLKMNGVAWSVYTALDSLQMMFPLGHNGQPAPVFFQNGATKLRIFVEEPPLHLRSLKSQRRIKRAQNKAEKEGRVIDSSALPLFISDGLDDEREPNQHLALMEQGLRKRNNNNKKKKKAKTNEEGQTQEDDHSKRTRSNKLYADDHVERFFIAYRESIGQHWQNFIFGSDHSKSAGTGLGKTNDVADSIFHAVWRIVALLFPGLQIDMVYLPIRNGDPRRPFDSLIRQNHLETGIYDLGLAYHDDDDYDQDQDQVAQITQGYGGYGEYIIDLTSIVDDDDNEEEEEGEEEEETQDSDESNDVQIVSHRHRPQEHKTKTSSAKTRGGQRRRKDQEQDTDDSILEDILGQTCSATNGQPAAKRRRLTSKAPPAPRLPPPPTTRKSNRTKVSKALIESL